VDFEAAAWLPSVNSVSRDGSPSLTADELTLYFVSSRPGSLNDDTWVARRASKTDNFDAPQLLTELASPSFESSPNLSRDGRTLYFISDRGSGDADVWAATRQSADGPFGSPVNLTAVNSQEAEDDPAVSPDGLELFFSSERGGRPQLWHSTRVCP